MAGQLFILKRLSVITTCETIAVMSISRERKAIWDQGAQTNTRVVDFALLLKGTHNNSIDIELAKKLYIPSFIYLS